MLHGSKNSKKHCYKIPNSDQRIYLSRLKLNKQAIKIEEFKKPTTNKIKEAFKFNLDKPENLYLSN